ncbi:MAG: SIS domain-containing protein [Planctomycetota bacterium]|jgi:KpsF/GutQ family protein|nr:SIS domain-containing protein [Planctomycetota bacterium]
MNRNEIWDKALHVWKTGANELERLGTYIDKGVFISVVEAIADCRGRVATAGVGTSAAAARKIAHSLCCIERPAFFLSPGDAVHGGLGAVRTGDVAILISKGGGTREIVNIIPALRTKKALIIGVTENPKSPLAENSELAVQVEIKSEADEFNMLATTSTMAVVAYFDAVAIALMARTGYTREQFAVIHPGGAVGGRLLAKKG